MTTTVRSVRVELEASVAGYIRDMKLAGSETDRAFHGIESRISRVNKGIGDLDKSSSGLARTSADTTVKQTQLAKGIDDVDRSSRRAGPSIDKYSGRLRTVLDLVTVLGPAAGRLALGTLPAVAAGINGIGAGAGAIGVTALAVVGLGDAFEALNKYQLDPTAENLQALRVEQEKLGPAGAQFLAYLDDLEPELHRLQLIARAGLFPGVEDGIDDLITRLPIVRATVRSLAKEMGDLAADAGDSLSSREWNPFFEFVRTTAAPTLDAFARSSGNVALGLANILVAFDPLSRRFTTGLEDMTGRFAEWSKHLDDDQGFQNFLDTVEEAGPELLDLAGSVVALFSGIAHASAPLARTTLPLLTGLVKGLAAIADSPAGPAIYTTVAGLIAFNRISSLAVRGYDRVGTSLDRLGTKATTTQSKLSLLSARGGVVLAGAAAVATLADSINRIDPQNLDRSLTALQFGNVTDTIDKVVDSLDEITATRNKVDLGEIVTVGGLLGDSSLDKFANNIDQVDQSLANLVESGHQADAADLFQKITDLASAKGVSPEETAKHFDAYALALQNAADESGHAAGESRGLARMLGGVSNELDDAAQGAQAFSDALAGLNGWLDKRQALREYRASVHDLGKALHDGFQPKDADTIDQVGRSITQVASTIKDRGLRADFLAGARASLVDLANKSGPKAKQEVEELIGALDRYGLTKPPAPKLDADDGPARGKVRGLKGYFEDLVGHPYTATINANTGQASAALNALIARMNALDGRVVTTYTNVRPMGGQAPPPTADGGTVPKSGRAYADRYHYLLADGEEVISNRYGQADRNRGLLKAINANRMANGGTAGDLVASTYTTRYRGGSDDTTKADDKHAKAADRVAHALHRLEHSVDKVQRAYDKEKSKLDDLISQRSSTASAIASAALHDPFGNGLAGLDAQVEADTNDIDAMTAALATLVKNGLDPKSALYQQLAASMDVTTAQELAQLSSADLASRATRFQHRADEAGALGSTVAGQAFNDAIAAQTKATNKLEDRLHSLEDAIKDLKHLPKDIHDQVWHGARDGTREGSEAGTRAAHNGRNASTAGQVATAARPLRRRP